mmetsp:Transcript_21688/g.27970  ORF Transcript_21688/g.27970 Transcript_21688/m.27970 type:complete len:87 (-) Transcript_21688:159-419(-)
MMILRMKKIKLVHSKKKRMESSSMEVGEVIINDQKGEEEEHTVNIRVITIAVCIFFFYPLILLATLIWKRCQRPLPKYEQSSEEYE